MVRPKTDRWETSYRQPGEVNWSTVTFPKKLGSFPSLLEGGSMRKNGKEEE